MKDPEIDAITAERPSMVEAMRAIVNRREFKTIVALEERVRAQRREIAGLAKLAYARISKAETSPKTTTLEFKPGMWVSDGFGRKFQIKTVGPEGYVDSADVEHRVYLNTHAQSCDPPESE